MRVLVACEFSGIVRDAFRAKGYDAVSCDFLPSERPGPHIQGDVLNHLEDGWVGMIGHPPCTHTAVSGARWFKDKAEKQQKAHEFFMRLWNAPIPRVTLEQPISVESTLFRKPDQIIQPWQFGEPETKATSLWVRGWPLLRPTKIIPLSKRRHSVWREPPSSERWKNRSRMFQGVADAMADQYGPTLDTEKSAPEG